MTTDAGALLVFDEVMTGFRIAYGCAQKHFGVTPDVTTMGKVIGGGLPVGATAAAATSWSMVAPAGPHVPGGHVVGQPLGDDGGHQDHGDSPRPGQYEHLDKITERLIEGIIAEGKAAGHAIWAARSQECSASSSAKDRSACFRGRPRTRTTLARWHGGHQDGESTRSRPVRGRSRRWPTRRPTSTRRSRRAKEVFGRSRSLSGGSA